MRGQPAPEHGMDRIMDSSYVEHDELGTCSVRANRLQPVPPFAATLLLRAERRVFAAPVSCAPTTIPLHLHLADRFPVLVVVCVSQPPSPSCLPGGAERLRTASYNYNSLHEQSLTVQETHTRRSHNHRVGSLRLGGEITDMCGAGSAANFPAPWLRQDGA